MTVKSEAEKARNRAKAKAYRDRKRAERLAAEAAAGNADDRGEVPTTMRDAVREALAHMKWLAPSDIASEVQAMELAKRVDVLTHADDETRALSAHRALSRVLTDLGGTPIVRMQRELRSLKQKPHEPEGVSESGDGRPKLGGNVTEFKRPEARAR